MTSPTSHFTPKPYIPASLSEMNDLLGRCFWTRRRSWIRLVTFPNDP
jgi:hypothetical protein